MDIFQELLQLLLLNISRFLSLDSVYRCHDIFITRLLHFHLDLLPVISIPLLIWTGFFVSLCIYQL
jgi:hypothetical protein